MTDQNHASTPGGLRSFKNDLIYSFIYPVAAVAIYVLILSTIPEWIATNAQPLITKDVASMTFALHLTNIFYVSCIVLVYRKLRRRDLLDGIYGCNAAQLVKCCIGVISLFCIFQTWLFLSKHPVSKWELEYVFNTDQMAIVLLNTAILVPLSEELLFRVVLPLALMNFILFFRFSRMEPNPSLKQSTHIIAIVLSCFIFAVLHQRDFAYLCYFLVLGLWFGYWVYKTSGLMIAVIGHSLAGLLAVGTIYFQYA